MAWLEPARASKRFLLLVLVFGFGIVVSLLTAAGAVAARSTRSIESDAAQVGREQIEIARLFNDLQAGQSTMAQLLRQLALKRTPADLDAMTARLEEADRALANAVLPGAGAVEANLRTALGDAMGRFSTRVRELTGRTDALAESDLDELFTLHTNVVLLEQRLLTESERRLEDADSRIASASRELATDSRVLLGSSLVIAVLCAFGTVVLARSSIRTIEAHASELSRVSWHMVQGQETAARRFSHELHDELGQSLAAIRASVLADAVPPGRQRDDCVRVIDEAISNVRELSQLLRPVILDDFGLDAGLRWLTDGFAQRTGITTRYASTFEGRVSDDIETHVFRIAQEALTNVARHSGASEVAIHLSRADGRLRLTVEDDGRGMPEDTSAPRGPSLGLVGMRARAADMGGEFWLSRAPAGGVRLTVDVPVPVAETKTGVDEDAHSAG